MEFHKMNSFFILIILILAKRVHCKFARQTRNTTELVRESGFDCEEVTAFTEDGYILRLFHILNPNVTQHLPIILFHGFMDSSDTYLIRLQSSPAINLTQSGYDVWIPNMRGNKYSRRHVMLDPDEDKRFWDFSFNENGHYDYPAIIDRVLEKTDKPQVLAIGHSQGTLNFFIMGSTRPEYNSKIKLFIAVGPVFYLQDLQGITATGPLVLPHIYEFLTALGEVELLNHKSRAVKMIQESCMKHREKSYKICLHGFFFSIPGGEPDQIELEFLPVIVRQYFSGSSVKLVGHLNQIISDKHFGPFDYGEVTNMEVYGSTQAPFYNLTNISTKVVLMVGKNDNVATVSDSILLSESLPNATYFQMPHDDFGHWDFVWSNQMEKYFFPYLHKFLDKYK